MIYHILQSAEVLDLAIEISSNNDRPRGLSLDFVMYGSDNGVSAVGLLADLMAACPSIDAKD